MTVTTHPIPQPARATPHTPEGLLDMPDGVNFELVDGRLVERTMGSESSWVALQLAALIIAHCRARGLGWVFGADAGYQCFPDAPDKVRKPDVSFIRLDRLPGGPPKGHCRVAPDVAAEVISPNELYSDVEEKVREYLAAGVRIVWVIDPPQRSVRVHRADGSITDLRGADLLTGEAAIPEFRCPVAELFAPPAAPQA